MVRVGEQDIALQSELFNGTKEAVEPYDLGMGLIERDFKLVDIPRATAFDVQKSVGFDGRASENQYEEIAPGSAGTITAVFSAPPPDAAKLWFMTDVLLPVGVPIQPAGFAALIDDPVLTGPRDDESYVNTLMCASESAERETSETPVEIKLPSDVLFEFSKSELTPAAQAALDEVEGRIGSAKGTITIEGHTDAFVTTLPINCFLRRGPRPCRRHYRRGWAANPFQRSRFRRVPSGRAQYQSGRQRQPRRAAQNRRVEIRTGGMTAAARPQLEARPLTDDLPAQGATAHVDSVKRVGGHLLTTVP